MVCAFAGREFSCAGFPTPQCGAIPRIYADYLAAAARGQRRLEPVVLGDFRYMILRMEMG
jgi:hypothetical protein